MGSSVSKSRHLSEDQIEELVEAGIPRHFYTDKALNSWYRSFFKACKTQDEGRLSRDRFCKLIEKYVRGQSKTVTSHLKTFSNRLFDGFRFPDRIDARMVEVNNTKRLVQDRFGSDETDSWIPARFCSTELEDGQIMFIDFTRFMVVMTQIMDYIPAGRKKVSACHDMRIEWMFQMIIDRESRQMTEDNWVNIHEWVRSLNNEEFGESQKQVVRDDFACMLSNGFPTATFTDFQKHLDRKPRDTTIV